MRIGELAERTGTPRRLLRYYEEQGLITPRRAGNGYREYDDPFVDRVTQIRGLLAAGLPTRVIQELLPCLDTAPSIEVPNPTSETIATLEREHQRMSERIEFLVGNRDAIAAYLEGVRERAALEG